MGSTSPAKSRPDPRPTTLSMICTAMTRALGGSSRGDVVSFSATMQAPILAAGKNKRSHAQDPFSATGLGRVVHSAPEGFTYLRKISSFQ